MDIHVKICGLTRAADVADAVAAGADYVGLVRYPRSPRHVDLVQARCLADGVPGNVCKTVLTVDPDDQEIEALLDNVGIDLLQLHGSESPDRVNELKGRFGLRVMKAIGIATDEDLSMLDEYADAADQLLVDAKPVEPAALPGGNGLSFDWRLMKGLEPDLPWMLAGGLDPGNVETAISLTGCRQVDVSSGVESSPGIKDGTMISEFIRAAKRI